MHHYSRRKHLKRLTLGIATFLLMGSSSVMAEDPPSITGTANDTYYTTNNIRSSDGTYTFTNDLIVKSTQDTKSPLDIQAKLSINAPTNTLTFNHEYNSDSKLSAALKHEKVTEPITITAKTLKIINKNTNKWAESSARSIGILAKQNLTINGNVDIETEGAKGVSGIQVDGKKKDTNLTINGDLKISDKLTSTNLIFYNEHSRAIELKQGELKVTGDVDLTPTGTGIYVKKGTVIIDGGGKIQVSKNGAEEYAIEAIEKGTVILNVVNNNPTTKSLTIRGNIHTNDATITLGLATKDSTFTGAFYDDNLQHITQSNQDTKPSGKVTMYLQNGATWTETFQGNKSDKYKGSYVDKFIGGEAMTPEKAGVIKRKEYHASKMRTLTIADYSGHTYLIYEHKNSGLNSFDYFGNILGQHEGMLNGGYQQPEGKYKHYNDTVIKKASPNSSITLLTNKGDIDLNDDAKLNNVLSTLAGKLFYEEALNGTNNLTGYVGIYEGLLSSAKYKKMIFEKITDTGFDNKQKARGNIYTAPIQENTTLTSHRIVNADSTNAKFTTSVGTSTNFSYGSAVRGKNNKTLAIDLSGHDLDLQVAHIAGQNLVGIMAEENSTVNLQNGTGTGSKKSKIAITLASQEKGKEVAAIRAQKGSTLTIDGDVTVKSLKTAGQAAYGIQMHEAGSKLDLKGKFSLQGKDVTTTDTKGFGKGSLGGGNTAAAIQLKKEANVTIAEVDIDNTSGNLMKGIETSQTGGNVLLKSGKFHMGTKTLAELSGGNLYINTNEDGTQAQTGKVDLQGDVQLIGLGNPTTATIALTTKDSKWVGNRTLHQYNMNKHKGTLNLFLQNGGTWETTQNTAKDGSLVDKVIAGAEAGKEGVIYRNDASKLTINNLTGHLKILYSHKDNGENLADYTAGETHIKEVATGSKVMLLTDNQNIDIEKKDKVFDALAQKLYYDGYVANKDNLTATVGIADGLIASSAVKEYTNLKFQDADGKAYVARTTPVPPPSTTEIITDKPIVEKLSQKTTGFWENYTKEEFGGPSHTYNIDKDVTINIKSSTRSRKKVFQAISWENNFDTDPDALHGIDMQGHKLTLNATGDTNGKKALGMDINGNMTIKNTKGIAINLMGDEETGSAIYVRNEGDVNYSNLLIENANTKEDTLTLRNTGTGEKASLVNLKGRGGSNRETSITVKGLIDAEIAGTAIEGTYGTISLAGGKINATGDQGLSILGRDEGKIFVNSKWEGNALKAQNTKNDVTISGNIFHQKTLRGTYGSIGMALNTDKSSFTGLFGGDGNNHLILTDKAIWNHQNQGAKESDIEKSKLTTFQGQGGYIYQKASKDIEIGSYEGDTTVFYEHQNKGEDASDYTGGNIKVTKAKANSAITLLTDNKNIILTDKDAVGKVLNTLAGKLYYLNHNKDTNLTGTVGIADGLLTSSVTKAVENIAYDKTTGQGQVQKPVPPPPPVPRGQTTTEFTTPMYSKKTSSDHYVQGGVMQDDDTYHFEKETTIKIEGNQGELNGALFNDDGTSTAINVKADKKLTVTLKGTDRPNPNPSNPNKISTPVSVIKVETKKLTTITAPSFNINATGESGSVSGISFTQGSTPSKDWKAQLTINGDVNLNIRGQSAINGIYTTGNSKLTLNGNINAIGQDDAFGIYSKKGAGWSNGSNFLYAGSAYKIQQGAEIYVTGDVKAKMRANGLYANGGHAKITVLGGGYLEVDKKTADETQSGFDYYALRAESGTVNLNVKLNARGEVEGANDKDLVVKGNIGTLTSAAYETEPELLSTVNLAFATKNSEFNGIAFNQFPKEGLKKGSKTFSGAINLFLQNGATWTHEAWGKTSADGSYSIGFHGVSNIHSFAGGQDATKAGRIYQTKENNKLHIDEYSGHTAIFYNHKTVKPTDDMNKGYEIVGGDVTVDKAKAGSHITLVTDSQGLNLTSKEADDKNLISGTLNNLAHKLYYTAHKTGEKNLTATVGIAEGILSSSTFKTFGTGTDAKKVDFDASGQGKYNYTPQKKPIPTPPPTPPAPPTPPVVPQKDYSEQITGNKNKDKKYTDEDILDKNKNDSTYNLKAQTTTVKVQGKAGIAREEEKLIIKGEGKNLVLENTNTLSDDKQYGIHSDKQGSLNIDVKKLDIKVENSKNTETAGIHTGKMGSTEESTVEIKGEVNIKAQGANNVHGVYVQGKDTVKVEGALNIDTKATKGNFVTGIYTEHKDAKVEVTGDVDVKANGTGILASEGSNINIKGGGKVTITENTNNIKKSQYALKSENSTVNFHYEDEDKPLALNKVNIYGNIGVLTTKERSANDKKATLSLGLNTVDSSFTGVAHNEFAENDKDGGKISLRLENGAKWENKKVGEIKGKFTGSHIYELTSNEKGGHIYQQDINPIYIDNIKGKYTIHMEHEKSGTQQEDYKVGNIYLKNAQKGSEITLITQNSAGLNLEDKKEAYKFFNTIANKLFYTGAKENMKGKVIAADHLLDPAKVMRDITFDQDKKGQGMIQKEKEPNTPNTPNKPKIETGDYETTVMKGTRTSMLSANLLWRNYNNDMLRRLGELRLAKEESGIWTKYQGGESNFDGKDNSGREVKLSQKYNIVEIGYDKKLGDYTIGVALDHGTTSDTYFGKGDIILKKDSNDVLTGSGKVHMTGLSLYGTKIGQDGSYFDFIGKIGQVKSDYDVSTSLNTDSIHGSYKTMAYSLSGEYGKRIHQNNGFYYEPSVELTFSKVSDKHYRVTSKGGTNMDINQQGMTSAVGRLGVSFGKESTKGHQFIKLAIAHEFSGDIKTDFYIEKTKERKEVSLDLKDTWLDLEVGTSYKMSDNSYFYGTYTQSFGAKLDNKWRLDAGLRFAL